MEDIINLGIPHVGEQIFQSLESKDLTQCQQVSQTWKILSEKAWLYKTWKGKMFEACRLGKAEIVKLLLENYSAEENALRLATLWLIDFHPSEYFRAPMTSFPAKSDGNLSTAFFSASEVAS